MSTGTWIFLVALAILAYQFYAYQKNYLIPFEVAMPVRYRGSVIRGDQPSPARTLGRKVGTCRKRPGPCALLGARYTLNR